MTLNLTVVTLTHIFQSSDFRLSSENAPLPEPRMKLVTLNYPSFQGSLCFTGLAKESLIETTTTADHIVQWLSKTCDMQFHQLVQQLQHDASHYIRSVETRLGVRQKLTIVCTAQVNQRPTAAVISNFEDTESEFQESTPRPQLEVSWLKRSAPRPVLIVTGAKPSITPQERADFRSSINEAPEEADRIRNEMKALSRWAAKKEIARLTVSEGCTVVSVDPAGSGLQSVGNEPGVEVLHVTNGINLGAIFSSVLGEDFVKVAKTRGVISSSFASSRPLPKLPPCRRIISNPECAPAELIEVPVTGRLHNILGIDDSGQVLGSTTVGNMDSTHAVWVWDRTSGLRSLRALFTESTSRVGRIRAW